MKTFVQRLYVIATFAAISMLCLSSNCVIASETGTSTYKSATTKTEIEIPEVPYVGMSKWLLNSTKLGHYTVEKKVTDRTYIYLWYESDIIDSEHLQCKATVCYYSLSKTKTIVSVKEVELYNKWKKYASYNKSNSDKKKTTYSHEPSVEGFSNEEDFYDYYYYDFFDYEDAAAYYRKHGGR